MKKNALLLILLSAIIGSSCSKFLESDVETVNKKNAQEIADYISQRNLQVTTSPSGLKYIISKTTTGKNAKIGDEVTFHFTISLLNGGKVDSSSRLKNEPAKIVFLPNVVIFGLEEAISLLKEGERGNFILPSTLAFGPQGSGIIPANANLRIDLEMIKIRNEDQIIDDYVKAIKLPITETTTSGLRFLRTLATSGAELKAGTLATVKYTGFLTANGVQFDTGQFDVTLGTNAVVKGFEEGLLKMKVGEKATLVFPSKLGYGPEGRSPKIPPYASLIFNVEIVSAK